MLSIAKLLEQENGLKNEDLIEILRVGNTCGREDGIALVL